MGRGLRKRKRQLHKFVCGGVLPGNLLRNRMPSSQPAKIASLYRYPVKGLSPEPLTSVATGRRPDVSGRPPLCHRKRPQRLRPCGPEVDGEGLLPDADAGRMAGGAAHAFRRCEQRPDHQPERLDRSTGQSGDGRRPGRRSSGSSRPVSPERSRDHRRFFPAGVTAFRTSPGRSYPSSISAALPRSRTWSACPFTRCGSVPTSMSAAGRHGMSSNCSTGPSPSARRA